MTDSSDNHETAGHEKDGLVPVPARRQKRSDAIAGRIRDLISQRGLKPGDRIPQSWLAEEEMKASKGTVREAMKALETQGLIKTRTGPGGGAFVTALAGEQAMALLGNLFLFHQPSIADIYTLRKLLEPELVAGLAGTLDDKAFAALQATIRLYDSEPRTAEEEFRQRISELDFHSMLAQFSQNRILGFILVFLHRLLRDMTVCREIYATPNPQLREVALTYQVRLVRLLRAGDGEAARSLMREHMEEAERYMLERATLKGS
jgi:GntR family transcriptional regulator, transcriptional repressor for pyruvate dehydrogenase complex